MHAVAASPLPEAWVRSDVRSRRRQRSVRGRPSRSSRRTMQRATRRRGQGRSGPSGRARRRPLTLISVSPLRRQAALHGLPGRTRWSVKPSGWPPSSAGTRRTRASPRATSGSSAKVTSQQAATPNAPSFSRRSHERRCLAASRAQATQRRKTMRFGQTGRRQSGQWSRADSSAQQAQSSARPIMAPRTATPVPVGIAGGSLGEGLRRLPTWHQPRRIAPTWPAKQPALGGRATLMPSCCLISLARFLADTPLLGLDARS